MGDRIAVLSDGVLQQVGTPRDLYEAPANRFVAAFIGSPAMNFMTYRVEIDGGQPRLVAEGAEIRLDEAQSAALRMRGLKAVEVGVRPEHLSVAQSDGAGLRLTADVDVIEFLGNDELIHAVSGQREVVAIVNSDVKLTVGSRVVLTAPPGKLHLFDPQTGLTLGTARQNRA